MKRNLFSLTSVLLTIVLCLATGCRNERDFNYYPDDNDTTTGKAEEVDVEVAIDIPQLTTSLRALTPEQENNAEDIQVLVFSVPDGVANDQETYEYPARIMTKPELKEGKYYVKIRLNANAVNQRLVFLANIPGGKLPESITKGMTKKAVYEKLVYDYAATGWNSNKDNKTNPVLGTDYDRIPMWGESNAKPVSGKTVFDDYYYKDGVVRLYRSLARVDVGFAFDAPLGAGQSLPESNTPGEAGKRLFDLKEVYVYHPATKYRMAGDIANNIAKPAGASSYQAITPTLPNPVEYYKTKKQAELQGFTVDPNDGKLVRTIYIPEHPVTPSAVVTEQLENNTCIVIGGVYKGNNYNPKGKDNTEVTYYRVDFVKADAAGKSETNLPILRNHRYRINIQKVDGPGHKTTEDAINNTSADIIYTVSKWDENDISKVVTDGTYWLKLSKDQLNVGKVGGTLPIKFQTNWPKGWELVVPEYYVPDPENHPDVKVKNPLYNNKTWVTCTDNQGKNPQDLDTRKSTKGMETKEETVHFTFPLQADPNFKGLEGAFVVQANGGRLNWTVRVKQTNELDLELEIFEDEDLTQAINFIEVHEEGYEWDYEVTVDGKTYNSHDLGSFKSFFVKATPYVKLGDPTDPNKDLVSLTVSEAGGNDFMAWDWETTSGLAGPENKYKELAGSLNSLLMTSVRGSLSTPKRILRPMGGYYWGCVSNEKFTDSKNGFETRINKYTFTLTVKDPAAPNDLKKAKSISKTLTVLQQEHNIRVFTDKELTKQVSLDEKDLQYYLMNGKTHNLYIKCNIPGYIQLVKQGPHPKNYSDANKHLFPIEEIKGTNNAYTKVTIPMGTLTVNQGQKPQKLQDVYFFTGNLGTSGEPGSFSFKVRDDIKATEKLRRGEAVWNIRTTDPFFKYKFKDADAPEGFGDIFKTEYLCVAEQPEANSYVMELDNYGLLIPLSRINSAADVFYKNWQKPENWDLYVNGNYGARRDKLWVEHNQCSRDWDTFMTEEDQGLHRLDEDDDVTAEFIWADVEPMNPNIGRVLYDPDNIANSTGPITSMDIINIGGERFLYVLPGEDSDRNVGNVLVAVRSSKYDKKKTGIAEVDNGSYFPDNKFGKKAILWSWHIISVRKGKRKEYVATVLPSPVTIDENTIQHPGYLNKELGAHRRITEEEAKNKGDLNPKSAVIWVPDKYEILGTLYQWGRKDPFPSECYERDGVTLKFPFLKDAKGNRFDCAYYGDDTNGYRFSYKQSIENPTVAVRGSEIGDDHWMAEGGGDTTNGTLSSISKYQISYLWGGVPIGSEISRKNNEGETIKSVFDPCPYGFKLPEIGFESTMPLTKDAYFIREVLRVNRAKPQARKGYTIFWAGKGANRQYTNTRVDQIDTYFHTTNPVHGGMGRNGCMVIAQNSPHVYTTGTPSDNAPKYGLLPVLAIINVQESDYEDWWMPRARGAIVTNNGRR